MSAYDPKRTSGLGTRLPEKLHCNISIATQTGFDPSNMSKLLTRSKFGVYAALFASLIQLVASFGHVHSDHLRIQPVALESAPAVHPDGTRVGKPFDTDSDGPFADICDVCAMLNLIASGQVAAPPPLPTRIASCESEMPVPTETMPAGMQHLNFRSRAPPFA